jgi:clan AA aspartic protease
MGLVYTNIELIRGADLVLCREGYLKADQIKRLSVKALVDSGAYMLAINQSIKAQLNLQTVDEQIAELADGTQIRLEVVGPVEIHFENRRAMVDAMVLPGEAEVLLGAIPMEEMDVMVDPKQQQLIVNPASPYITKKSLK